MKEILRIFLFLIIFLKISLSIPPSSYENDNNNKNIVIDEHTYYERLKKSKIEVIIGLILIFFIPFIIWTIEKQVVKYEMMINRCYLATREIFDPFQIKYNYEGRPILVKGLTAIDETIGVVRDTDLGYQPINATVRLKRKVEMFQWIEHTQEEDDKTTYTYETGWYEHDYHSTSFRDQSHINPSRQPNLYSQTINAERVYVGSYLLSTEQVNMLNEWQNCPIPSLPSATYSSYHNLMPRIEKYSTGYSSYQKGFTSTYDDTLNNDKDYIVFNHGSLQSPEIGTVRISYEWISAANPITTVGVQIQNTFRPYRYSDSQVNSSICCNPLPSSSSSTSSSSVRYSPLSHHDLEDENECSCCLCYELLNYLTSSISQTLIGSEILLVEEKITDVQTMFRDERKSLFCRLFLIRFGLYFLFSFGIFLFFKPISNLLSFIPIIGSLIQTTLWIASLLIGFTIGILITSLAWIIYRPSILTGNNLLYLFSF